MSRVTRRSFLKQAGLLAALGLAAPGALARPGAPAPLQAEPLWPGNWQIDFPRVATAAGAGPAAPAATALQLQTPHQAVLMDLDGASFDARFSQLAAQGYRLIWEEGGPNNGGAAPATYSALWVRDGLGAGFYGWRDMTSADYQAKFTSYAAQGFRPISVSGYVSNGQNLFAAVWLSDPGTGYVGVHGVDGTGYQNFVNNAIAGGFRPAAVDGYAAGSAANYISVWAKAGTGAWVARHGLLAADYQSLVNQYGGQGYHVTCISGYNVGGTTYFAAFMVNDGTTNWSARHNYLPADLYNIAVSAAQTDSQPIAIDSYDDGGQRKFAAAWINRSRAWSTSGPADPNLAAFDNTVQQYMQQRNIPSGTLAVTKDSRLVYARGYRWDYDNVDPVLPTSLFRIASLTKPITALAVLRLVQEGHLKLSDRLVDLIHPAPPAGQSADPRLASVTVLNLLQHEGGWDRDTTFDPMFYDATISGALGAPYPISIGNIITYMTGRTLDFTPGTRYVYSNYGYCLLGRIIEAASGMPYATYVQQKVLDPLFITRMKQGHSEFTARQAGEVSYYTLEVGLYSNVRQAGGPANAMLAYGGFNLENMDAHGAWLASAVDLARLCTVFDSTGHYPILLPAAIQTAFAVPATGMQPDGSWYGCGWAVRQAGGGLNTWHNGSLPGTTTLMVRRFDGLNWVVLFNQRNDPNDAAGNTYGDIDGALHGAANAVTTWPTGDQFPLYGLATPATALPRRVYVPALAR